MFVLALPIVWARMVRDHNKMKEWYARATPESRSDYPVRMASHLMTFSPYYLHLLIFLLLFFLLVTLRQEAKLVLHSPRNAFHAVDIRRVANTTTRR